MGIRTRTALGALLVAVVIAAGCSDADDDDSASNRVESDDQAEGDGGGNGTDELIDASEIEAPEGSDPELRQEYIDAIVDASGDPSESGFEPGELECLSTAFVDAAGTDALSDAVTPDELRENPSAGPADLGIDFPENAGDVFYEEVSRCADLRAIMLADLAQGDDQVRACLDEAIDDELVKDYMVAVLITDLQDGDPERDALEQRLSDAIDPCLSTDSSDATGSDSAG